MNSVIAEGQVLGPYTILGQLGRGGMATVYRAYEPLLDRQIALKVLPQKLVDGSDAAERFKREAHMVAKLEHPNIVPVYAYGIDDGFPWMALRLVRGGTLSERMQDGLLRDEGLGYLGAIANALDHAHSLGVIHRDLKPQNVLLGDRGELYLADFGVAMMLEGGGSTLTLAGTVLGTPEYMAPEQAQGETIGPATDIYALGVIAYQWLAQMLPFNADTPAAILFKQVFSSLPMGPLHGHSERAQNVLVRALAKRPADRWPDASSFIAELSLALRSEGIDESAEHAGYATRPLTGPARAESGTAPFVAQAAPGAKSRHVGRKPVVVGLSVASVAIAAMLAGYFGGVAPLVGVNPPLPIASTRPDAVEDNPQLPLRSSPPETAGVAPTAVSAAQPQSNVSPVNLPVSGAAAGEPAAQADVATGTPVQAAQIKPIQRPDPPRQPAAETAKEPGAPASAVTPGVSAARFNAAAGAVIDQQSELAWQASDNGRDIPFARALAYCAGLGSGWRLPTVAELRSLYVPEDETACGRSACRSSRLLRLSGQWFWSDETDRAGTAWTVGLASGESDTSLANDGFGMRALCTRHL